ncbi:MAG: FxLYD domain-containing protein [Armatimonadota bacterium]
MCGWSFIFGSFIALLATTAIIAVAGCGPRYPEGSVDDLFVARKHFIIDNEKGMARVFAEVKNTGDGLVKKVRMEAILRSSDGDKRGTNNVVLENIKPGETRTFSLTVTSHSRGHTVEIIPEEVTE